MQNTVEINVSDLKALWQQEARVELALRIMAKLPSYHHGEVLAVLFPKPESEPTEG